MPRRHVAAKRTIISDPKYKNVLLAKFINVLMKSGKKSVAEKIVYESLDELYTRYNQQNKVTTDEEKAPKATAHSKRRDADHLSDKVNLFKSILDKVKPTVEVRSRRIGGATYQIPMPVDTDRGIALAMRWIVYAARDRNEHGMMMRLANELFDALHDKGVSIKKRDDTHKMAKANQAFAHFRWG